MLIAKKFIIHSPTSFYDLYYSIHYTFSSSKIKLTSYLYCSNSSQLSLLACIQNPIHNMCLFTTYHIQQVCIICSKQATLVFSLYFLLIITLLHVRFSSYYQRHIIHYIPSSSPQLFILQFHVSLTQYYSCATTSSPVF